MYVNAVAVTEDGKRFLSAGFDKTVRVWDLPVFLNPRKVGGGGVIAAEPVRGSEDAQVARGSVEGQHRIRIPGGALEKQNPNKDKPPPPVVEHKENVWRLALLGNDVAASASQDGTVKVFNHLQRKLIMSFDTRPKGGHNVPGGAMGVAFTPDGRIVYTGISDEHAPLESRPVTVEPF